MRVLLLYACLAVEVRSLTTVDFMSEAASTLLISSLRKQVAAPKFNLSDPVLDSPNFLPLCGNGKIDSKADYAAFYRDTKHPPLEVSNRQLFYSYIMPDVDMAAKRNITIAADEECDDGNRLDFDGCSADCMHMDLWTPACELAIDTPLTLESIIYDPVRNVVVVSALDGIYALYTRIGGEVINAVLIAAKSFPVTTIFRRSNSIILYSSFEQSIWQLLDGGDSITIVRSFPELAKLPKFSAQIQAYGGEDGSITVNDFNQMIYIKNLDSSYTPCNFGDDQPKCTHLTKSGVNQLFRCGEATVEIGEGVCNTSPRTTGMVHGYNIWADMMRDMTMVSSTMKLSFGFTIGDPTGDFGAEKISELEYWGVTVEVYHPMGGFLQATLSDPRKLWSVNPGSVVPYFTGDPTLLAFATDDKAGCGPDRCIFDNYPGYDITKPNPFKNVVSTKKWNDILQDLVDAEAAKAPALQNFAELWENGIRYGRVHAAFLDAYKTAVAPLTVASMIKHPVTHNIWALKSNSLVEVSTSGVQIRRPDGTCIPSGVALCPKCQWAPNGRPCRPCSESNSSSWSWNAVCKACSSGRRLLADGTVITFVLKGNMANVMKEWPSLSLDPVTNFMTVSVTSSDVMAEMKSIKTKLLSMEDVQVVMAPYVVVNVGAVKAEATDNTAIIVVAVLVPCLVIIVAGLLFYFNSNQIKAQYQRVRRN